jgi:hypothetical protein
MLNACRGSNARATNCFIEGTVSFETRSKAFLANCTITCCNFTPIEKDRLQLQIDRLHQQPAVMCKSAAQVDLRGVSIANYDTALFAHHKDSKIHCVSCKIQGSLDAAIEVIMFSISSIPSSSPSNHVSGTKESFSEIDEF